MTSWLKLTHQTAVVTGGGSGIGAAIAKALCREGCNVVLADVDENAVKQVAEACTDILKRDFNADGDRLDSSTRRLPVAQAVPVVCDMTNKSEVRSLIRDADELAKKASFGFEDSRTNNLDQIRGQGGIFERKTISQPPPVASILINSAGITKDGLVHTISLLDYETVLDVNLKGTFLACQAFCAPPRLESICKTTAKKGLSIINIGSIISKSGNVGQTNYAASKGGVVGLTRALAKEMAFFSSRMQDSEESRSTEEGIVEALPFLRVNAILPGFISSPMVDTVPQAAQARIRKNIALKRFGKVDDVANMALFLASEERSGYVTGECWECSGMISL